jgi:phytoene synthase
MNPAAIKECQKIIDVHSRSFSLAARFLSREVHDRAVVLYAWCRRADDAVDLIGPAEGRQALERLRAELEQVYGDQPLDDPVLNAFREVTRMGRITRAYPEELLEGLDMDVRGERYLYMEPFLQYCYRVAGTVGLMMCHVMGMRDERAIRNAVHLGIAMQITNICRDVEVDWNNGRLYIPDEILADCGLPNLHERLGEPFPDEAREPCRAAIQVLLREADGFYRSGYDGLGALSWRSSLSIRIAGRVYQEIGARLAELDHDPLAGRAIVSRRRKLELTTGCILQSAAETPRRAPQELWGSATTPPERFIEFPGDILPVGAAT